MLEIVELKLSYQKILNCFMEKVSIIIPVLRESEFLEGTLSSFASDLYPNKEIIAVIDEPTKRSLDTAARFNDKVRFILNKKRIGKSNALNAAVKVSDGDILFFFDSDNMLDGHCGDTISKLVGGMRGKDVIEFKIDVIKDSLVSKMVGFEFANANLTNILYSRFANRKPLVGGAAFAIRREVFFDIGGFRNFIAEDLDFGWRAFEREKSYKQIDSIRISTKSPSSLSSWFVQRRRWAVGTAEWFVRSYKSIFLGTIKSTSSVTVPSIFILFPTAVLGVISLFLSESLLEKFSLLFLTLLPLKIPQITPAVFLILTSVTILKSTVMYALGFTVSLVLSYIACRSIGQKFSVSEFAIYYFVYSPVMLVMFAYGFFRVCILRNFGLPDWKV